MIDLRKYADVIRAAIKENRNEDEHYSWKLKAINKGDAKFQWGYLSDKDDPFVLHVYDDVDGIEPYIDVKVPYVDERVIVLVGDKRWHDAKTLEDGIYKAIKAAAKYARHYF